MNEYTCDPAIVPYLGMYPRVIGFTGTREGMKPDQFRRVEHILESLRMMGANEFHEGDCVGADAQAAAIAEAHGYAIVAHPPTNPQYRAFFPAKIVLPEKDYLERNRDIVDMSHLMIGAPKAMVESTQRSGTWYTITYARSSPINRPIIVVGPDGGGR